jgi:pimeloyl-ACP methyl ester carboxylesterase
MTTVALHTLRPGAGVPLVLLHAFPLDSRMWSAVVDLLPPGLPVLAADLPGLGASGTADLPEPSLDATADALADALAGAGHARVAVAGLSMGGYVALALVERHPDLVVGLGLLDTKATADPEEARANRLRVADAVTAAGTVDEVLPLATALLGDPARARSEVVDRVRAWIGEQDPAGVAWSQRAMAARPDRTGVLAAFDGPVLVLVGEQDGPTPVDVARSTAALAGTDAVVLPGAGHLTAVESPEAVAAALAELVGRVEL